MSKMSTNNRNLKKSPITALSVHGYIPNIVEQCQIQHEVNQLKKSIVKQFQTIEFKNDDPFKFHVDRITTYPMNKEKLQQLHVNNKLIAIYLNSKKHDQLLANKEQSKLLCKIGNKVLQTAAFEIDPVLLFCEVIQSKGKGDKHMDCFSLGFGIAINIDDNNNYQLKLKGKNLLSKPNCGYFFQNEAMFLYSHSYSSKNTVLRILIGYRPRAQKAVTKMYKVLDLAMEKEFFDKDGVLNQLLSESETFDEAFTKLNLQWGRKYGSKYKKRAGFGAKKKKITEKK